MASLQNPGCVPTHDSDQTVPPGARWLGPVDPSDPITFSIRVRAAVSDPSASSGDLEDGQAANAMFVGNLIFFRDAQQADLSDLGAVCEFASQTGLAVVEVVPAERIVVVSGTAGMIGAAFGIVFAHYLYDGKFWRGHIGHISLPSGIAHVVEEISGLDDGLPDLVSSATISQAGQRFSGRGVFISRVLFVVGGALIALGAFVNWRHVSEHAMALHTDKPILIVATRPAVVTVPPATLPVSKDVASSYALKALMSAGLTATRESEAEGMPRASSGATIVHASVPSLPSRPASSPTVMKGASIAQPARPTANPAAHMSPQRPLPSRGQVQHTATPPSTVPPMTAGHPAPPLAPQTQKPPVPPAPQKPAVQAGQPGLAAPIQAPRVPIASSPQAPAPNPLCMVRIGPVLDHDRATAIAKQLSVGGFAQVQVSAETGYRVLSEPLPRKAAESLITTLTGRGFQADMAPLTGDTVQVLFGVFTAREGAEALSRRIAAVGYDAWIREGTVYTLRLGPYPSASVTTIKGLVNADAPEAPVTTDPIP